MATEQEKLDLEVKKLGAEIRGLNRPAWRSPAGITAIVAMAAVAGQFVFSKREYQLSQLQKAEVVNEKIKLEHQKAALEDQLDDLGRRRRDEEKTEATLREQVARLNRFLRDNSGLPGANALIGTLHGASYPLNAVARFKVEKTIKTSVSVNLASDGTLKLLVSAIGPGYGFSHKGFTVSINDLETGELLKTFSTGALSAKGKQTGLIMMVDFASSSILSLNRRS